MIRARGVAWFAVCLVVACGGVEQRTASIDEPLRELPDARALELISTTLARLHIENSRNWDIDVSARRPLRVDIRLDGTDFGVEYVTEQDRVDMGADVIPEPDPEGQLRIMRGTHADSHAQVLVLDATSYEYDEHLEHVQGGAVGIRDAEGRLARDVEDFVAYARGQDLN